MLTEQVQTGPDGAMKGQVVQIRDASGSFVRNLTTLPMPTPPNPYRFAVLPDGDLLTASELGCTTTLTRISQTTGRPSPFGTIAQRVGDFAISPDGLRIAYVTQQVCTPAVACDGHTACGYGEGWNTLAVRTIASGATVSARTKDPNWSLRDVNWSPDGKRVAVIVGGPSVDVNNLDAAHPDFAGALRLARPALCTPSELGWFSAGVLVSYYCASGATNRLLESDAAGIVSHSYPIATCAGVAEIQVDPARGHATVALSIGYGNGACSGYIGSRIQVVSGGSLVTVLSADGWNRIGLY